MKEKYFVREVVASLKKYGLWAYKIPDPMSYEARKTVPRPFDVVFIGHVSGGLEVKVGRPGARLERHQVYALRTLSRYGVSGVLVYTGRCRAYFVPAKYLRTLYLGKKFIQKYGVLVPKRDGIWEFRGIFKHDKMRALR